MPFIIVHIIYSTKKSPCWRLASSSDGTILELGFRGELAKNGTN